jgi:hypothetical protein
MLAHDVLPGDALWAELEVARLTYPSLSIEAQRSWLMCDRVNFNPRQPQGHFTFRESSNRHGKSFEDHLAAGHSHGLLAVYEWRFTNRKDLMFLFFVDLRRAMLNRHLATRHTNRDGTPFMLFDVMTPGVERFCERLRTR